MKPLRPALVALFILLSLPGPGAAHEHIEGFDEGTTRIVDKRPFVRFDSPYHLTDLSRDGRLVAFTWWGAGGETTYLGVIDLTQGSLRFLAPVSQTQVASFSPEARQLLIRRGRAIDLVDVASGAITRGVAKAAYHGQVRWLDDGRLAYLTPERKLVFHRPGAEPTPAGLSIPDPKGYDSLAASVAVSPDGTNALWAQGCRVYLRHLPTRKDEMLNAWNVWVPERAWSPDGGHFVLQRTSPMSIARRLSRLPPTTSSLKEVASESVTCSATTPARATVTGSPGAPTLARLSSPSTSLDRPSPDMSRCGPWTSTHGPARSWSTSG